MAKNNASEIKDKKNSTKRNTILMTLGTSIAVGGAAFVAVACSFHITSGLLILASAVFASLGITTFAINLFARRKKVKMNASKNGVAKVEVKEKKKEKKETLQGTETLKKAKVDDLKTENIVKEESVKKLEPIDKIETNSFVVYKDGEILKDETGKEMIYKIETSKMFPRGLNELLNSLRLEKSLNIKVYGEDLDNAVVDQDIKANTFKDDMFTVVDGIKTVRYNMSNLNVEELIVK